MKTAHQDALDEIRVTWLGHSTVVLDLDRVRLLTDPVLRSRVALLLRAQDAALVPAPPAIDAVLLSHVHHDHLDVPTLRRIGATTRIVAPVGVARLLHRKGFSDVVELDTGDVIGFGEVTVRAVPAVHDARRGLLGPPIPTIGFVVTGAAGSAYFAGDTDVFDGMREIAPRLDVALLPVAGWGPRTPAGHLDPERAVSAILLLRPRVAVPIHWGTYRRIGMRTSGASLRAPAEEFARLARELAPLVDVRVVEPGASTTVALAAGAPT